ncbi:MAG: hypothetical protein A2Y57_03840 [Candidatus Woykebacteria bacterium RBG_13_40_7b]|uniref:Uncharacterized protein n=1 Tax=Candidatus Woykebacteria bacterium RBG_13_40_7b TaxID=1802594 RepID=A0A1G1WAX8_9BACT|nr:MAG: hypothetical protein A2Y57_03840 [Candidatus Woykebacteria bacterium RBG_13_40_7b]
MEEKSSMRKKEEKPSFVDVLHYLDGNVDTGEDYGALVYTGVVLLLVAVSLLPLTYGACSFILDGLNWKVYASTGGGIFVAFLAFSLAWWLARDIKKIIREERVCQCGW